jgi:murein biosynthesis integral membrane protein MurJ
MTTIDAIRRGKDTAPERWVGRATLVTAAMVTGGTALGFLRDLVMAHLFGANSGTDAFLVGWTIPETLAPLLIEDAMALLMVPVITRLLQRDNGVRPFVRHILPRLVACLSLAALVLVVAAPVLVHVLAPGLADPDLAVRCVRLTALTVVTFGVAGFMSATLRAHHRFGPPAAIYLAYNVGILLCIGMLAKAIGITSAAIGVACGGLLMIAVQARAFLGRLRAAPASAGAAGDRRLAIAAVAPIVIYTLTRQAQVFVERFFGSDLAAGSISHLNYAQKVAQVPMVLSVLIVTVTYPRLARDAANGDLALVARRIQQNLVIVSAIVLCATAFLVAFAPAVIHVLFEHGHFTSADTAGTASILRVYALGLWGQAMVTLAVKAFFARGRPAWRPAAAVAIGLAVTAAIAIAFTTAMGTVAIAAANAAGITCAALLLLVGVRLWVAPISLHRIVVDVGRLLLIAAGAGAVGLRAAAALDHAGPSPLTPIAGFAVTTTAFVLLGILTVPHRIASFRRSMPLGALGRRHRTDSRRDQ